MQHDPSFSFEISEMYMAVARRPRGAQPWGMKSSNDAQLAQLIAVDSLDKLLELAEAARMIAADLSCRPGFETRGSWCRQPLKGGT